MTKKINVEVGDLLEVVNSDNKKYKCIVIESYSGGFTCRVLEKDKGVGTGSWSRYSLNEGNARIQSYSDVADIKVLAHADKSEASSTLSLNESVTRNNMTYYTTPISETECITLCMCEGHGGWSAVHPIGDQGTALKESFFNSCISKINEDVAQ